MLKIFVGIIAFAKIALCLDFRTVCDTEIKSWVLNGRVNEQPKPQFDAKDITFHLSNRNNHAQLLDPQNPDKIDKSLRTVFIVHSWFENFGETWIYNLTQLLVTNVNVNVIAIDYSKYSHDYFKASAQVVKDIGQFAAKFLKTALDKNLVKVEDTYFIGFGLGAHISGVVGKEIQKLIPDKKLARITGLDPVGVLFNNIFSDRLEMSDANFVDVVQTNSDWLGSDGHFGQVTFRMNGGKRQPKCPKTKQSKVKKMFKKKECTDAYKQLRCSHLRSTEYWAESVLSNNFVVKKSGIVMGVNGSPSVSGEYVIKTRNKPPYGRGK